MKSKNKISPLLVLPLIIIAFAFSCKKENKCVGGSGGNVTIKATIAHHANHIYSLPAYRDTVHVRFNAQDYPSSGLSGFNATYVGDAGKDYVMLTGLTCGDYYLYATGGDTVWTPHDTTRVRGGIPYSTDQTSGEIDLTIPVNE